VLRLAAELLVDAVPGIGFAADAATLIDMANTIAELRKLKIDADAAIEFVKHGPYSLEELQVSSNYEEFSSYGDYSSRWKDTKMTKYEWLQTQPYDVQREEGLKILRGLHILK
jgi:hypothetical protein